MDRDEFSLINETDYFMTNFFFLLFIEQPTLQLMPKFINSYYVYKIQLLKRTWNKN